MTPERWQQIETLFQDALARDVSARLPFLDESCNGDGSLRAQVEALLVAHDCSGAFLESPALEVAARKISKDHSQAIIGKNLSHYRIDQLIGSGGMGEVFAATDTRVNRKVALKLLPDYFTNDAQRVLRFEQEARAVLALNHPNIVTIYEVGESDGTHFITTEFIEGETLRALFKRTRLAVTEALDIAIQIGDAVAAAHAESVVHRDIKPENIMIRPDGYVKVLDFGIAKLSEPQDAAAAGEFSSRRENHAVSAMENTNPGVMGTARYMSPEQVRGSAIDARTDIWSLGVVLYEMLAGRAPFKATNASDCMTAILETRPEPLSTYDDKIPAELQWITHKALRKDRDERYQTAKEMLSDLREVKQDLDAAARLRLSANVTQSNTALPLRELSNPIAHFLWNYRWIVAAAIVIVIGVLVLTRTKDLAARPPTINSLAVLPFVNVAGNTDSEYVADGVTESLINDLSQLPNVKVIARNSVFRYKVHDQKSGAPDPQKVARELNVQAVLIGRIIQHGDNLFVSAELIKADDNSQIWGAQYNRKVSQSFTGQEQVAREISQELQARLAGDSKRDFAKRDTENLKALQYFMEGRSYVHRRTREDLMMAGSYYQKAIEQDPNYALAYAGLAEVYGNLGVRGYIPPIEGRQKLEESAHKAIALDDNLAEAHVMMGYYYMGYAPYDFANGDRELKRAIELSPSLAIAHLYLALSLMRQNRLDEGLNEMLKARELDPFSAIIARQVALYYLLKRDYSHALEVLKQANELGPPFTTTNEIGIYIQNKSYGEALSILDKENHDRKQDPMLMYSRAMVYAAQGRRADALKIEKDLEQLSPELSEAQWIAKIYSALNEKDEALSWLDRGLKTGTIGVFYVSEPAWDNIRSDARFRELLQRMGIPP